jgi:predicted ribosomally synthesized peptide with SipW-like signal peptide
MAYSRKFLTVGAMGVAAFALIGAGATASFNDSVTAQQDLKTGSMNMTIAGANGWSQAGGKTLTLPTQSAKGSTFTTGPQLVTVTNNGTVPSKLASLVVTAATNNGALKDGLRVKITTGGTEVFDGNFAKLEAEANANIPSFPVNLAPGASKSAWVEFYAKDLPNEAQGSYVTPKFTVGFKG